MKKTRMISISMNRTRSMSLNFVGAYSDDDDSVDSEALPENTADTAINCAFIGVGAVVEN